ncbi:DNA ligase D [Chitinophaga sp. 22321]|uniref:DNA ligase (ATP) n=1 Tax=Chitinophaga hostae TaxID=2831022 RepID=A0ABS5JBJ4_9BACT|nr:DNA ligase D [Chitinophaga hostae]MBS0032455.1 DNA ligase D [Chitinophaga hostae]
MSLEKYRQKRTFTKTPEPTGGSAEDEALHFVVQQHHASHLHYDFRLEMQGVLKSWAVPKGPSMDPDIKRLAMQVEDHPYDYKDFEGTIPPGNYGAGTVIVWDRGEYIPEKDAGADKKKQTKDLLHQLHSGRLHFTLKGKKLKGSFALVKATGRGDNAWLLMKLKDRYAVKGDITTKNKSVMSGKTLEQVAKHPQKVWESNRQQPAAKATAKKKATVAAPPITTADEAADISGIIKKGKKAAMPKNVKPMLAALTPKPFDKEDWLYEIKWDGYRAIAYLNNGNVELLSRNQVDFNNKFAVITGALKAWKIKAVTDGEIVALDDKGNPDFQALQNYVKHGKSAHLVYHLFDLLWYNGKDYTHLPLAERKQLLQYLIPESNDQLRFSNHIAAQGTAFYQAAINRGLEGIMAKAANSSYIMGRRSDSWLKIKNNLQTEAIICGYTAGRNSRKHFGAIILGKYTGNKLKYIGHTGGGFNEKLLKELFIKFQPLITAVCPFKPAPKTNMPATWLKPELVCEVKFAETTADGILRQPIFLGLREDKKAADEKNIKVVNPPLTKKPTSKTTGTAGKTAAVKTTAATSFLPEDEKQVEIKVDGKLLKFTNLDKLYWPEEGITKRDMINYYAAISDYILPYLKDRPQSLNRFPEGIKGFSFYQKNVEDKVAAWIERFPYTSDSDGDTKEFMVCTGKAGLLYMANLGCIELNPWHSRVSKPDRPDYCLIDLDPDTNTFNQVIDTALEIKNILDEIGVPSFVKTSGATGMHILIPLGAKYTFEQSRMLAELIVGIANKRLPATTSVLRTPAKRKGKIYLDFLQNRQIQTMASAYSLRPRPGATASAPLHWEEVKRGLKVSDFNIYNMPQRLAREGDLLKGLLGKGIDMRAVLNRLKNLL